jgi:hypothetical protein
MMEATLEARLAEMQEMLLRRHGDLAHLCRDNPVTRKSSCGSIALLEEDERTL